MILSVSRRTDIPAHYCYANHSPTVLRQNLQTHDPDSPLLCGQIEPEDAVRERRMEPSRQQQTSLFDGDPDG